jgi:hypothetical protein
MKQTCLKKVQANWNTLLGVPTRHALEAYIPIHKRGFLPFRVSNCWPNYLQKWPWPPGPVQKKLCQLKVLGRNMS